MRVAVEKDALSGEAGSRSGSSSDVLETAEVGVEGKGEGADSWTEGMEGVAP